MKNKQRHSDFDLEALEPRILLSADGADLLVPGAAEAAEVVLTSAEEPTVLPENLELAGDTLYPVIEGLDLLVNADGVFDLEGRQLATDLSGLSLAANSVVIADGVDAEDWQIDAATIYMGEVNWVGGSQLYSDELTLTGRQSGQEGSSLTVAPRQKDAAISLGTDAEGFSLDSATFSYLSDTGIGELIIGQAGGSHAITIDGLNYVGNLTLRAPALGGHFDVLREVNHSGGTLTHIGSGQTTNLSANVITTGVDIYYNDSIKLVDNGTNQILLDTTSGAKPGGANIYITGSVLGSGVGEGGVLYLNAGTGGEIRIDGDVGTSDPLDGLVIINAGNVIFNGNILTNFLTQQAGTGNTTFGNSASDTLALKVGNLDLTTQNNITFNGDVTLTEGDIDLTVNPASLGTGKIHFKETVTLLDGDILIQSAKNVEFTKAVDIQGSLTQLVGAQASIFRGEVDADSILLTSNQEIRFMDEVRLAVGDMTLTSNDVNFTGGAASIIGALDLNNLPLSQLTVRPVDNTVSMDIGSPVGGVAILQFTTADIAALADGFAQLTFGYLSGSTNAVRVGNAIFLDPVEVFGGSVLVNGTFNAKATLDVEAASGGIEVTNTQARVSNDQIANVWQSSAITFTALQGNIAFTNGGSLRVLNQDDDDLTQGSLITLDAQIGSVLNAVGSAGFQTARDLVAGAAGDIVLLTEIKNLSASSSLAGDITIDELDDLHVSSAVTADGSIALTSGGDTTLDYLSSDTDSTDNDISVEVFNGYLDVGQVLAGTLGDVTLSTEGALTGFSAQVLPHVVGNLLSLIAADGIGEGATPLLILANSLEAANSVSGAVVLSQVTGRTDLEASIVNDASGTGDHVSLSVASGDTVINATGVHSASAAGIRLVVFEDLRFDGDVSGQGGPLSIFAGGTGELSSGVQLNSGGGDVLVEIGAGFAQAADTAILSGGGHLYLRVTDNILLGALDTRHLLTPADQMTWGNVAVQSVNGYVQDTAGSGTVNVYANQLTLRANTGIGDLDGSNELALESEVALLAAVTVNGSISLKDQNNLTTGTTSDFTVELLNEDGSTPTSPVIPGLTAVNGLEDIMLSAVGQLTLGTATAVESSGSGVIALFGGRVAVEGAIRSAGGNLYVKALSGDISLTDDGDLSTAGTAAIVVEAVAGGVLVSAGQRMDADQGSISLLASANVTLGQLEADNAVSVLSTNGSVRAAAGGLDSRTVITTADLAITAGIGINGPSGSAEALRIAVDTLAVAGSGNEAYRIENDRSLLLDDVTVQLLRYTTLLADSSDPVLLTGGLDVLGAGDLELIVNGNLDLAALKRIATTGAGDILVRSSGAFTMATTSLVQNENGMVDLQAGNTVALAAVTSSNGDISIRSASGSIIDNDPLEVLVDINTLGQIDLAAATGIGIEAGERQTLHILAGTLSAETVDGGIFIHSTASFATNGLISTGAGIPVSVLSDADLTVGPNGSGVAVDATGDVVLMAGGNLTQIIGGAMVSAADIRLASGATLTLVDVSTPGDVALTALVVTGLPATTATEITATGLLLDNVGSFGSAAQPLRTSVAGLVGTVTAGTLAFANDIDLSLNTVSVETTAISPMGSLPVAPFVQSAVRLMVNGFGEGIFADIDGSLTVDAGAGAALTVAEAIPVLWQTSGTQTWNDAFTLGGGDSTFRSASHLSFFAGGNSSTGNGDIYLDVGGDLNFSTTSGIHSGSGSLLAESANKILMNGAIISSASVGLLAGTEISVTAIGGPVTRVTANELILRAGYKITSGLLPLTTNVNLLSARSGAGGVYVANTGNLVVSNLGFSAASLNSDASVDVAFSGHQGGIFTTQAGAIGVNSTGSITVQEVAAVINAFPGTDNAISIVADQVGPDGNTLNILFDIVTSGAGGNPPTTVYTPETSLLTVTLRRDVSTLQEILDAINASPDFLATAVLAEGPIDGSQVFTLAPAEDFAFFAEGGRREGVLIEASGTLDGGAEAIAAVSQILLPGEAYNILFTSLNPGVDANAFEVRLLDDGPGGNLTDSADAVLVDWDDLNGQLNLYINFGVTTVGTLVDAVNAARDNDSLPFSAELNGSFVPSDLNHILGDAGVTLQSNLSATAELRPTGPNNDFDVVSTVAGPLYNQINFRFVDDGSVPILGTRAAFNDITNILTIYIQSGVSTANQVVGALNSEGTFNATLLQEFTGGVNSGAGTIQAHEFALHSGAVGVNSLANLQMVGMNNDLILTADIAGADQNGIKILLLEDEMLPIGAASAAYTAGTRILEVRLNSAFATAGNVMTAINSAAAGVLTATLAPANSGFGGIELSDYPQTGGGTGGPPEAVYTADGLNNDFKLVADSTDPLYENIQVFVTDDGSITDGSATASYLAGPRHLILNVQSGVTTLNDLLSVLNADLTIPVSGTLLAGNDGSGVFNLPAQSFISGVDAVKATAATLLPSGVEIIMEADVGGIAQNGIEVVYALNPSLAPNTASAQYFDVDDVRLLQIQLQSSGTTLDKIEQALTTAGLPFSIANLGDVGSLTAGGLALRATSVQEGNLRLSADGDISLIGRVQSRSGGVSLVTAVDGNLTFDSETARIVAISVADIDLAGSFANLSSLENPLIRVYGNGPISIIAGENTVVSEQPVNLLSGGDLTIGGDGGMTLNNQDLNVDAGGDIIISTPVDTGFGNNTLIAGGGITLTPTGSVAGADLVLDAVDDFLQDGNLIATGTGTISVTSSGGTIVMGTDAETTSDSGDISYTADGNIGITSIASTSGNINVTAGGAISDTHAANGTNLATGGVTHLTAQTGIGSTLAGDLKTEVGDLQLRNLGATGDIVVTETAAGGDLTITELTQNALVGWSILTVDNGDLTFIGPVTHSDVGSLVLGVNGNLLVQDEINLGGGDLSAGVLGNVTFDQDVNTIGGDVRIAATGVISMDPAMTLDADGGNVLLQADGNVLISHVLSPDADVRIESTTASVLRAANGLSINVTADTLQLEAALSIGSLISEIAAIKTDVTRLNASARGGDLAVHETNALLIGDSSVTVNFAQIDKTTVAGSWIESQLLTQTGSAVLRTGGALSVESISLLPTLSIDGNFHLNVLGVLTLTGDSAFSNGAAQLISSADILLDGDLDVSGGSLFMQAGGLLTQDAASELTVLNDHAVLKSGGIMSLSRVDTGTGNLGLTSGADLLVDAAAPALQLTSATLRLQSGGAIGSVANPVALSTGTLSALAVNSIHLDVTGDVDVNSVEVSVDSVNTLGLTTDPAQVEAAQADLVSTLAGNILVRVSGLMEINDGDADNLGVVSNGTGVIYLEAGSLDAYADITSADGNITLNVGGVANWLGTASVLSENGDLHIESAAALSMADQSLFRSSNGNILVDAVSSFLIGSVQAANGLVAIDAQAVLDNGDSRTDIVADQLQILADTFIGQFGPYNAIEIDVNLFAAAAADGITISEHSHANIGAVSGAVAKVDLAGLPGSTIITEVFGLTTQDNAPVSVTAVGSLNLFSNTDPADAVHVVRAGLNSNIFLQSSTGRIIIEDAVSSEGGHITLRGYAGISLSDNVSVSTHTDGTLSLFSANGPIGQASGSQLISENQDIVLQAASNISLAEIQTNARVAVTSLTGAILDNNAATLNVSASSLRLFAGLNIATGLNPLEILVTDLSARTLNGAMYLSEVNGVNIIGTEASTQVVAADGSLTATPVALQSGLVSGGAAGAIVLTSDTGGIHVMTGSPVTASQAGNILLSAAQNLDVDAAISSGSGSITLEAQNNVDLAGSLLVSTAGAGQIQVLAGGTILSGAESRFVNATGNVALVAAGNITLGGISSTGRVAIGSATGSIVGAGSLTFNFEVIASQLLISAEQGGVGALSPSVASPFRTRVGRIAGSAGAGGLNLVNDISVSVDVVSVASQRVLANGSLLALPTSVLSDLQTVAGNGSIVLRSTAGAVTLNEGVDADALAVSAHGTGNVRIAAALTLTANADVLSGSGNLTLRAVGDLLTQGDITTSGAGDVYLRSDAGALTMGTTATATAGTNMFLRASHDITLGNLVAIRVAATSVNGIVLNGAAAGLNFNGSHLRLEANGTIGSTVAPLMIDAQTVAAVSNGGGIYLDAAGDITVGLIGFNVNEVLNDATVTPVAVSNLTGLVTTANNGNIILIADAGTLTVDNAVTAHGSGNILLSGNNGLSVRVNILSTSGHISLLAGNGSALLAGVDVATGGSGSVYLDAGVGAFTMDATATLSAPGGSLRVMADGNLALANLTALNTSLISLNGAIVRVAGTVTSTALRISSNGSVGTAGTHLRIATATLSALSSNGDLFFTETDSLTVTGVTVTTPLVGINGASTPVLDAELADLSTGFNGDITLVSLAGSITLNDGGDEDFLAVEADGSGVVRLTAALNLAVNSGISSGSGDLTLIAGTNISFGLGVVALSTADPGSVFLLANGGAVTMTGLTQLTSTGNNIRVSGADDVTLGNLSGRDISVISIGGRILNAVGSNRNLTAESLRLESANGAGIDSRYLTTNVDTVAGFSSAGSILLNNLGDITVGSVGMTVQIATDATLTGLQTTDSGDIVLIGNGNIRITHPVLSANHLRLSATDTLLLGDLQGMRVSLIAGIDILNQAGENPNLTADALRIFAEGHVGSILSPLLVQTNLLSAGSNTKSVNITSIDDLILGSVSVTAGGFTDAATHGVYAAENIALTTFGSILDGGDSAGDVRTDALATLAAVTGIGSSGAGGLEVRAGRLDVTNSGDGSVYLNLMNSTELQNLQMAGAGYLYVNSAGTLLQSGTVLVSEGSAFLTVASTFTGSAGFTVHRDLRLLAEGITLNPAAVLSAATRNVVLRSETFLTMVAGSSLNAPGGDVRVLTMTDATLARVTAGRSILTDISGDLFAAGSDRTTHELTAPVLRLSVDGKIHPILTRTARMDVRAGEVEEIYEFDDLTVGRYGFDLVAPDPGDEFVLKLNNATLNSMTPDIRILEDVVFVIRSNGQINMAKSVLTPEGDIRIEVGGFVVDPAIVGAILEAPQGEIHFDSLTGSGAAGNFLIMDAVQFRAAAASGNIVVRFPSTVEVSPESVTLGSGSGEIVLEVSSGNISLAGKVIHNGNGNIELRSVTGGVQVDTGANPGTVIQGNGEVHLNLETGTLLSGPDGRLQISAPRFSGESQSGNLPFRFISGVEIGARGLRLHSGNGNLDILVDSGNLTMQSNSVIRQDAAGLLWVNVSNGSFTMTNSNTLYKSSASSQLAVIVRDNFTVGQVFNFGLGTAFTSVAGSILGLAGVNLTFTVGSHTPTLTVSRGGSIDLVIDGDKVLVNGTRYNRSGAYINVDVTF